MGPEDTPGEKWRKWKVEKWKVSSESYGLGLLNRRQSRREGVAMTRRSAQRHSWMIVGGFAIVVGLMSVGVSSAPSVYPTGTTIYYPDKTWSGYTVFITPETEGVVVIDMNGRVVKLWTGLSGAAGGPARVLPGGSVIAGTGSGAPNQESL